MEVIEIDAKFYVANGQRRVGPFDTNAQAWSWFDRHSNEELAHSDQYNRIRMAVNGSYQPDRYWSRRS
jgi:hypothetical protein